MAEMKSLKESSLQTAISNVFANQASLFAQLQAVDADGYNALNTLIVMISSNMLQSCTEKANGMIAFMNALNPQGKVIAKKIGCFVMTDVMESSKSIMGQFFLINSDNFALLDIQEPMKSFNSFVVDYNGFDSFDFMEYN